ncbi:MAG TPA: Crp/Fnr family transcriptional regulator [Burkholderiales bacterium]|nr:Crp/Fnr family transcriptional regulator [Burkholderiales bacterium]
MKSPDSRVAAFLGNLPLFKEMSPEEIERIAQGTQTQNVPRGQILFQKGDPCHGFHLVVYGQIKLAFTSPQGSEKVVEIIGPGQSFGEAVMFMDKPYVLFAQALADSLLLHVSKKTVFQELERDPKFARKMLSGLSRRLHGLIGDVEAYSLRSGVQRVIGFLLRDEPETEAGHNTLDIMLPTSKGTIASRLSVTPEHFSRILHELSEAGLIRVEGRAVHILDIERLRRYGVAED